MLLFAKRICDTLHDLVPFTQFREHEKHPQRSLTLSKNIGPFLQFNKCENTDEGVSL